MLRNPFHQDGDPEVVRELIREFPWAIIVSTHDGAMVASHYPVLLDEDSDDLAVVTHVGRPDDKNHRFDGSEVLLIIQGRHGYISPSWYVPGTTPAPTWNFSVVHAYGVPEIVDPEENFRVLTRLVAHFEQHVDDPMYLDPELGTSPVPRHRRPAHPDHAVPDPDQDEPRQGPGEPAERHRPPPCTRPLPGPSPRRRHGARPRTS